MLRLAIGFAISAAVGVCSCCLALAASPRATVATDRGCYRVGQRVGVRGSGFAQRQLYDIAIDGVDFGQRTTDAAGAFRAQLIPGGLDAGIVQHLEQLNATDGLVQAETKFALTRNTGARFRGSGGDPKTLRAPFQVWGFGFDGKSRPVYLHYVGPSGRGRSTVFLGQSSGKCGYLQTKSRSVFPFSPSLGRWKLQIDSVRRYNSRPKGPVARILVSIKR